MLRLFVGLSPLLAIASPLPAVIPTALSGSLAYHKKQLINFRIAKYVLIGAAPINILSAFLSDTVKPDYLMLATGCVMIYVAVTFLIRSWLLREEQVQVVLIKASSLIIIGVLTGILSGFLAVGGGVVMVPAFVRFAKLSLKESLATSLICVAALAVPGTIVHGYLGHSDWTITLILAVTSIPTSYLSARFALRLRNQTLERMFGIFMLCFAVYFLLNR
jgi:uncharacterized membrane protein YfcA